MHRIQINLLRNEATPVYQKSVINENTCANWWKEIGISRKDLQILPTNDVCIFCHSSEDCENKFGEFLLHHFSGKSIETFFLCNCLILMQFKVIMNMILSQHQPDLFLLYTSSPSHGTLSDFEQTSKNDQDLFQLLV